MVHISRILCPTDFSEFSRDALDHAVAFAKWYGADLTVMHVFDIPPVPVPVAGMPVEATINPPPVNADEIADKLRRFTRPALVDAADISVEVLVTSGRAAFEIARQAERMAADLLVLGTHVRSGFERLLIGSVTERLLRTTNVPIMTVPPPVKRPDAVRYNTILCPVDFSDASMRALEYALSLAKEANARIILLHVLEGFVDEPDLNEFRTVNVFEYFQRLEQDASRRLAAAVPDDARVWARPIERIVKGKAHRQILRLAEEDGAELIVMGVSGQGALSRALFGSTTDHVIRAARCPVLTLHS